MFLEGMSRVTSQTRIMTMTVRSEILQSEEAEEHSMTEAEKLFNQLFARWFKRQSFITSFRQTALQGMKAAGQIIQAQAAHFVDEVMYSHKYDKLFVHKQLFFETLPPEKVRHDITEQTMLAAQIGVDAASIVFAHSVLDGAALDYCRVTALVAPHDWEPVIEQRSIKLSDARESDYEQLLRRKIDEFFEQLEWESLLKKTDYLFARCQPPPKWSPMDDYVFDRDRLEKLDRYRHDVIHGDGPIPGIAAADEEVDYLMRMVLFFQGLVNLRYGLKLDPFYAFTGMELPKPMAAESAARAAPEAEKKEP